MNSVTETIEIPGYKIIREIGRGGMANVYLALQESFEREVALKVMSASLAQDQTFSERFLREAKIVAQLIHPNIVTVYDVGIASGHHYLSMEFVPGQDLKHALTKLSLARKCDVICQVAQALNFARLKGYIHRDVKPENIRLQANSERVVLMDFGIAKATDLKSGFTQTGTAVGTPYYMSPEQARGKQVDHRSDLYSLGVVFYWLLVGKVPYNADSAVAIGIKHITEPLPRLPAPLQMLQPVLDKLMAKQPEQRYQTAAELVNALRAIPQEQLAAAASARKTGPSTVTDTAPSAPSGKVDLVKRKPAKAPVVKRGAEPITATRSAEEQARLAGSKGSVWPWLIGVMIALGVAGFVYWQQAQLQGDHRLHDWFASLMGKPVVPSSGNITPPAVAQPVETSSSGVENPSATAEVSSPVVDTPEAEAADLVEEQQPQPDVVADSTAALVELEERLDDSLAAWQNTLPLIEQQWQQMSDQMAGFSLPEQASMQLPMRAQRERLQARLLSLATAAPADDIPEWLALAASSGLVDMGQPEWQTLQAKHQADLQVGQLLSEAENYLAKDQLTSPEGANALQAFQQVLALDSSSQQAKQGIQRIAERYQVLARGQWQKGNLDSAQSLLQKGKSLESDPALWSILAADIEKAKNQRASIQSAFGRLEQLKVEGRWVSPSGDNAAELLNTLLQEADNSPPLKDLIQLIVDKQRQLAQEISERIMMLGDEKAFAEAHTLYERALTLLPETPLLKESFDQLLVAEEAARPKISALKIAPDDPQLAVLQSGPYRISAGRSIALEFQYRNFADDATLVQATLFDGTETLEIAQVPVVVNGAEGVKLFRIERPVEGFSQGRYRVKIVLNNVVLASEDFQVE